LSHPNPQAEEEKQTKLAAKEVDRKKALEKATEAFANSKSPDEALAEIERLKGDSDAVPKCLPLLSFGLCVCAFTAHLPNISFAANEGNIQLALLFLFFHSYLASFFLSVVSLTRPKKMWSC
jgi:hypothetical protein